MGKSETASAAIGIKILLSDLVEQINETNVVLIKKMLYNGSIEDENGFYNETYMQITYYDDYNLSNNFNLPKDYLELKEYLTTQFKLHGSLLKSKFSAIVKPDLHAGCLLDRYLLVPIEEIVSNNRWGYNREGINAMSTPFIKDVSLDLEEYKDIQRFKVVFIIKQDTN